MQNRVLPSACHGDLAVIRPSRQKFVKVIVACPHGLPKLPESYSYTQADLQTDTLFCIHCDIEGTQNWCLPCTDIDDSLCESVYVVSIIDF
jgi:hypothetical protein